MEKFKLKNMLKPRLNSKQLLKDWQRRLMQECHKIERQITDIQTEEKNTRRAIREASKKNDIVSAKALAKEIVSSKKVVNRLQDIKAQLTSISMHIGESVAIARTTGHLLKSAEVVKLINNLMKVPEMAVTMQEFCKEMTKAGLIEEMVNDAVNATLNSEDKEEEAQEEEVEEADEILTEIACEISAQLPESMRKKEGNKLPAQVAASATPEAPEKAKAECADKWEELEEIRVWLYSFHIRLTVSSFGIKRMHLL